MSGKNNNPIRCFVCRLAMRPCFVISSNALVKELLNLKCDGDTYNGLKDFFFGLFGTNIMFAEPDDSKEMRKVLVSLIQPQALSNYSHFLEDLVSSWITKDLKSSEPIVLYDKFKNFATMFTLKLFLGLEDAQLEEVGAIATKHWHGIISMPLNVKLSFLMSSSYNKALQAKEQLLQIIEKRLEDGGGCPFLANLAEKSENVMSKEVLMNNVLLFTCALIPKALASLLTSFMDTSLLWHDKFVKNGTISDEALANILLEVMRLWPPFFGGLRVTQKQVDLGEFHVPEGYGIFYSYYAAHRDPLVFEHPEEFMPERWSGANAEDHDKLFGFGGGPHKCIGENLVHDVMKFVCRKLIQHFTWEHLPEPMERNIKCLPVLRPRHLEGVILTPRDPALA